MSAQTQAPPSLRGLLRKQAARVVDRVADRGAIAGASATSLWRRGHPS
jgi:hypothetical protein